MPRYKKQIGEQQYMRYQSNSFYYWRCCNEKHDAPSLDLAQELLEKHEKEFHKGKPVGFFGWERRNIKFEEH